MYRLLFVVLIGIVISCSKEKPTPVVYEPLQPTYVSHRYKDRLTKVQLVARINTFISNADSFIQPKYDVIVYRIFYKTHDYLNNEITASGLVYIPEIERYFLPVVC